MSDVHAAGHAERVEDDVHGGSVREERHVLLGDNLGDDTLVAVASGHLVADAELALAGDVNLDLLDDAGIDVVAAFDAAEVLVALVVEVDKLVLELADDLVDFVPDRARVDFDVVVNRRELPQELLRDLAVGRDDDLAGLRVDHVERDLLVEQDVRERGRELLVKVVFALLVILEDHLLLALRLGGRHLRAGHFLLRGNLDVHDDAVSSRGNRERGVFDVGGFLSENRAKEALFGSQLGFALGSDFSDEDVAGFDFRADADHAVGAEVLKRFFADVRDVAGDFLGAELGVAGADFKLVDVDRGVDVLLDDPLGDEDRILEVVAVPRHERDEHVPAEGELAFLGVRPVGDDIALLDRLPFVDDRLLVDAGARVRAHELAELVNMNAVFRIVFDFLLPLGKLPILGDDNMRCGHGSHLSGGFRADDSAGVPRHTPLEAGPDKRRLGNEKRNPLALHVRSHERAVGVIVFEERNQPGRHRNKLLR